jgi:antitoxin ParD1/3/4
LKLERLRRSIDAGLADLERGDYEEVDDADLDADLDDLATSDRRRSRIS